MHLGKNIERFMKYSDFANCIYEILPEVLKPTRYIGNEINSIRKELYNLPVIRFALAFPDTYEVGMSHLGLKILYGILNSIEDVWAERVFAPWTDMEEKMRSEHLELFSLESFTPLREFDIIGFSLQYEMCYTNVLNMLELANIPLLSRDRDESFPLIIAGGPCTFNPEPIADFIDLFVIGDGEEVILEIIDCYRKNKGNPKILEKMAEIEGVYVPSLYPLEEQHDGTLTVKGAKIKKRVVSDINDVSHLSKYIVPFMKPIHDRAIIEVMRGCSRGCRFCQAGMIYRPVRERSADIVQNLAENVISDTGYEELSLASLSSCDYSAISLVIDSLIDKLEHTAISLPSLRTDAFSVELAKKIESIRKTGLTFAPEVATERMQNVINKGISRTQVLSTIKDVFSSGWETVKLYFLIGLPTETDEDIIEMAELVKSALRTALDYNRRASLNISISTFVPKAHTPFQWERLIKIEEIQQKKKLLLDRIGKNSRINVSFNSPELSLMEGIFARGDRKLCRVLNSAHKLGCKLDGWSEHFNFNAWMTAFRKCQIDPYTYTKERDIDQVLPYEHIDTYITKSFLLSERQKALNAELTPDCRLGECSNCGVCEKGKSIILSESEKYYKRLLRTSMIKNFHNESNVQKTSRIRFRFAKKSELRFISHLDMINAFTRAFRRAGIPIAYSQGYNPHPKISFGSALAVGITSSAEFADIDLKAYISPEDFLRLLNRKLPTGLEILKAKEIPLNMPSLMSQNSFCLYKVTIFGVDCQNVDFKSRIRSIMHKDSILINRFRDKDKTVKAIDIKPYIKSIELVDSNKNSLKLEILIGDGSQSKVRPEEVINLVILGSEIQRSEAKKFFTLDIHKLEFFLEDQGQLFSPI